MNLRKVSTPQMIVAVLLVVHLLPVWLFEYFPSQDGSSHVYNAYLLKDYHHHENYQLREVYQLNLKIFPNWASHIILAALMYIFPPIVCEKILVSLCIVFLPISLFSFLSEIQKEKTFWGLIGFIYAFNYLLHLGFYNFALSLPFFFFTLGYWWRRQDSIAPVNIAVLYVLLIATYLCHFQSYSLLVISLTFCATFSFFYNALEKIYGHKKGSSGNGKSWFNNLKTFVIALKPAVLFIGLMLPAYFIMMTYYLEKTVGYGRTYKSLAELKSYFFNMKSLVAFRDDHILVGRILLAVLAITFLITIWVKVRTVYWHVQLPESNRSDKSWWALVVDQDIQFVLLTIVLTVMYFKMPYYIHSGGAWINDRIHIYIFLVLLPFFDLANQGYLRQVLAGIIIVLSLWNLGYHSHTYYHLSRDIANMVSSTDKIGRHAILDSRPHEWRGSSDSFEQSKYVNPFLHLECYLGLKKGIAYLQNYEPDTDHFPLRYKNRKMSADYILVWRTEYDGVEDLESSYDLIHTSNYNRLYQRQQIKPDQNLWEGKAEISFDMQPRDSQTAPGHIPVFKDTVYTDGRYGWITRSALDEFSRESDISDLFRDGVEGEADAAFRLALPNGSYRVTCYFSLARSATQQLTASGFPNGPGNPSIRSESSRRCTINIIANSKKMIQKLKVSAGDDTIERSYIISVTDQRLTQVIYTRWWDPNKRWGWCGFSIKRLPNQGD